jgi:DNA polymerase III subunit delta
MAETKRKTGATMKNLYLFCGEDSFSAFEKAVLWKEKFLEKYGDLNCLIYRGEELTASEFQTALESYPFLSEKKLIFVNDFLKEGSDVNQKAVMAMLDNVPEYAVVLFWEHHKPDARTSLYKKLVKIGQVDSYSLKSGVMLNRWVCERFQKMGVRVNDAVAKWLADLVGNNLWTLNHEIEKVVLYADGEPITKEIIQKVVCPNPSSSIFKLTDLLGEKQLKSSLNTLEILLKSGESSVAMFFMLVRHFRIMCQVKDLADRGERPGIIAKTIKESPFVVNKIFAQTKYFKPDDLKSIYRELLSIDSGFKTGRIRITTLDDSELVREIEVFITKLCLV